jgi:hypothetical protein
MCAGVSARKHVQNARIGKHAIRCHCSFLGRARLHQQIAGSCFHMSFGHLAAILLNGQIDPLLRDDILSMLYGLWILYATKPKMVCSGSDLAFSARAHHVT